MTRFVASLLAAMGLAVAAAHAADPPSQAARPETKAVSTGVFLTKAGAANLFEVESGKLAITKTQSAPVREFAYMMVTDHGAAALEFKKAVAEAMLKAPPEMVDAKQKAIIDSLKAKDGAAFDRAYVEAQYQAHIESLELIQAYADKGDNARMRQYAKDRLSTLKKHLDHVTRLRASKT